MASPSYGPGGRSEGDAVAVSPLPLSLLGLRPGVTGLWNVQRSCWFSRRPVTRCHPGALSWSQGIQMLFKQRHWAKAHDELILCTPNVPKVSLKFRFFFWCCFSWQRIYETTFSTQFSNNVVIKGSRPGLVLGLPELQRDAVNQLRAASSAGYHLNISWICHSFLICIGKLKQNTGLTINEKLQSWSKKNAGQV